VPVFRRPAPDAPVGDAIPFAHDGEYHLFFLSAPSDDSSWLHWRTRDFSTWTELPVAVPADPDEGAAWTGSVIEREGVFHLFYTGSLAGSETPQTVCRATSTDLVTFVRDTANPVLVPDLDTFEAGDWRDPYVFFNSHEHLYWMVVAARRTSGPRRRRGCLALATSPDLESWTLEPEPLYDPGTTYCPECPEIFAIGSTWYLVYSRFSENAATVYRVAGSPRGPWRTPPHDALDGRRWYAAKSLPVGDGTRRMGFGWIADRLGDTDGGAWRWGGDFALPREIVEAEPGRLVVRLPDGVPEVGASVEVPDRVTLGRPGRTEHRFVDLDPSTVERGYVLDCVLRPAADTAEFGLLLRTDDELTGYAVTFDRGRGTVALAAWPQPVSPPWSETVASETVASDAGESKTAGSETLPGLEVDGPRLVERPVPGDDAEIRCRLVVEGSLVELFVTDGTGDIGGTGDGNDSIALSYRIYRRTGHELGFYAGDGVLQVGSVQVRGLR